MIKSFSFALCMLATVATAQADSVRDSFNYTPVPSDLNGKMGGGSFGMSGTWVGDPSFDIGAGSLIDPTRTLAVTGNRGTASSFIDNREIIRFFTDAFGVDNTTAYFSFLMRPDGVLGGGAYGGWFGMALRGNANDVFVGRPTGESLYVMERPGGANRVFTTKTTAIGESTLFVMRIDFLPGNDNIRLYVNPTPGGSEPATAAAMTSTFDLGFLVSVRPTGPGAFSFDEIQAGPTFSSVTKAMTPGDFDADGDVDGADFSAWQTHFPTAGSPTVIDGDADRDGDVDGADFVVWQTHFPFGPGAAVVAEPASSFLVLLALPVIGYTLRRRVR